MRDNTQYSGGNHPLSKKVYYGGSDVLKTGYALCYDDTALVGAADPKDEFGTRVVKPGTSNLNLFAGFVAPGSANKQGPCWIDIVEPDSGMVIDAFTHANMTKATTALGLANNDYGLVVWADSTLNLPMVAVAGETVNTSATAATKRVYVL